MKRNLLILSVVTAVVCGILSSCVSAHDSVPAPAQKKPIALVGATIHTVSGDVIANGTVLFDKGKITYVGDSTSLPADAEKVDLSGKHIYPGMFESHSQIGLTEITSVPATNDFAETGDNNANVKAQVAINPDSELIPVTRAGGVLLALSVPSGGNIAGKSVVLQMDGWTYEDLTLKPTAAMHVTWPQFSAGGRGRRGGGGGGAPGGGEGNLASQAERQLQGYRDLIQQTKAYAQMRQSQPLDQPFDLRLEGMIDVVEGRIPILVRADRLAEIQSVVSFAAEQNLKLIILGGYDAPLCAELLKKHNVPVIVSAVYRVPLRANDPYDHAYTLPKRLADAGIKFCISGTDRSESWNVRTLPFHAGTAVAFGLSESEAIRSVTLSPAEILGVADRVGSVEVGKDATLIVTDGTPLNAKTQILSAYIQGRHVDLSNRHTRLYEKYQQKYQQLREADSQ